jgi:hypothetical protein
MMTQDRPTIQGGPPQTCGCGKPVFLKLKADGGVEFPPKFVHENQQACEVRRLFTVPARKWVTATIKARPTQIPYHVLPSIEVLLGTQVQQGLKTASHLVKEVVGGVYHTRCGKAFSKDSCVPVTNPVCGNCAKIR